MKLPFLGLALLCPFLALASGETPADTILVKVGKKASVRFYGEKKTDLKALERYDWNVIVRDMNTKLGLTTPDEPRQNYVDLLGNSYLQDSVLRKGGAVVKVAEREKDQPISAREAWRNLKSGTQVGFSLGFVFAAPNRSQGNSGYNFLNTNTLSISLLMNTVLRQKKRHSFSLRWGVEFSRLQLRNAEKSELNLNSINYSFEGTPEGTKLGAISYVTRHPYFVRSTPDSFYRPKILEEQFDLRKYVATYLNLPIMPTWTYYDWEGKRTWRLSVGGYMGFRLGAYRKTVANGGDYKDKQYNAWGFNALRYGIAANIGYRNVNLFVQKDLQPMFSRIKDGYRQSISYGLIFTTN